MLTSCDSLQYYCAILVDFCFTLLLCCLFYLPAVICLTDVFILVDRWVINPINKEICMHFKEKWLNVLVFK